MIGKDFFFIIAGLAVCLAQVEEQLSWKEAGDGRALCNDFSRAGFFLRKTTNSSKWIIFLEGGSLCYSNDTCNRRFFSDSIRQNENLKGSGVSTDFPYGNFDPVEAFNGAHSDNLPYSSYVNPLMTSMKCLSGLFNETLKIEGRDIMDRDPAINPDFFDHNHVIIPYCSSDLWLGEEVRGTECNCSNLQCFNYRPDSFNLQFTFRGKLIFQSIFRQLQNEYGMNSAEEIVLAGSSAGGVGVLNHAKWVRDQILPTASLLVLLDSSWFINFQDNIYRIFDGASSPAQSNNDADRLLGIIFSNPACADVTFGYPCCISAHCILTKRNRTGHLEYYPDSQKTFSIFSLYDVFLLAPALAGQDSFATANDDSPDGNDDDDVNAVGLLTSFVRTVGEYGGEMNVTTSMTYNQVPFLSYYSTQCFQHVYLATSTLWGHVYSSATQETVELATFQHSIASGVWSNSRLSSDGASRLTIQEGVSKWYNSAGKVRYTESCQGPYCNEDCPDEFSLVSITSNNWPSSAKFVIIVVTVLIPITCIILKMLFALWLFVQERKQLAYLHSFYDTESGADSKVQLTECGDESKISICCLDLAYSITYKVTHKVVDERKDETSAIVLHDIPEESTVDDVVEEQEYIQPRLSGFEKFKQTFRRPQQTRKLPAEEHSHLETIQESESESMVPRDDQPSDNVLKDTDDTFVRCFQEWTTKEILKGISLYFNPESIIGIMGPSGSGKTTFLDILTGRRRQGKLQGDIYVNGFLLDEVREWYIANTGYVLQLATPYYPELTVRDNLTLAAHIALSRTISMKDKFNRVEQVIHVTGLDKLADTVVGEETGPGLSGGQKRRLAVGLQLLKMPSVVYLDEPTSGLDATSSCELLFHLRSLAKSGRTIILTIHQPRLEIFHMFDELVLLSDGKVAYYGAPEKAYEIFVSAVLKKNLNFPSLKDQNPAGKLLRMVTIGTPQAKFQTDVIMDMLGKPKLRKIILEYYETLSEPADVRRAITTAIQKEKPTRGKLQTALFGAKNVSRQSSSRTFVRLAALEARATKRLSLNKLAFLPMMFTLFALIVGTVYIQRSDPYLIVPAMGVFSCASGMFVFPAIELYFSPAIKLYRYEKANGVGQAQDLVLQGFSKYVSIAFFPVLLSTSMMYLLVIKYTAYSLLVYIQVLVVNISLNLSWTALLTALLMAFPDVAFRISSIVASLAGFSSGFFIPIGNIHWGYRWISYINPNYYALSSVTFFLLEDFNLCNGTEFECFFDSGPYILRMFFFDQINPYLHLMVLLLFTLFFLFLAVFASWVRNTHISSFIARMKSVVGRVVQRSEEPDESDLEAENPHGKSGWKKLKRALRHEENVKKLLEESSQPAPHLEKGCSFLSDEKEHRVWKYTFADVVAEKMKRSKYERQKNTEGKEKSSSVKSLQAEFFRQRQKTLFDRVNFAWKVLKEEPPEPVPAPSQAKAHSDRWKEAAKKATHSTDEKKDDFYNIVVALQAKQKDASN